MKTLIIHPADPTTIFLCSLYHDIPNTTVITGGTTKSQLRKYIENHSQVIMCGHGSPEGLLSIGQFPDSTGNIIDDWLADLLRNKNQNIYIWCQADKYVRRNALTGVASGMFISSTDEGHYYHFWNKNLKQLINESNFGFSSIVARHIGKRMDVFYKNVASEYGLLAVNNPIARFNHERLYYNPSQSHLISNNVA
jgi:hypothetical protein